MNRIICIILLYISVGTLLFAHSCVWKVSKDDQILYIGGTIHVLRQHDFPLPEEFDKAYAHASYLVFETDMEAIENLNF